MNIADCWSDSKEEIHLWIYGQRKKGRCPQLHRRRISKDLIYFCFSKVASNATGRDQPRFWRRRVDPGCRGFRRRFWRAADEALRVCLVGLYQDLLAGGMDDVSLAVMHLVGRHQSNTDVVVILVVPGEEAAAEGPGILDAAEALGELRLVFQGLEVRLRERIVV